MNKLSRIYLGVGIISGLLSIKCHSQTTTDSVFNESNYTFLRKGYDNGYPYVIVLSNKLDTSWNIKQIYFDAGYTILISKSFAHNNIANGPYWGYSDGQISQKAYFTNGKIDKERIFYDNSKIRRIAYFNKGVKVGVWVDYDANGKIKRETKYDDKGNIIEDKYY